MRHLLGISAYYHDSAAALVCDGEIAAAAQEERFSRRKNDERFPRQAIEFWSSHARLAPDQLAAVVFYDQADHEIRAATRIVPGGRAVGVLTFPRVLPAG